MTVAKREPLEPGLKGDKAGAEIEPPPAPRRQDIHVDYAPGPGKRESPIRQGPTGA